MTCAERNEDLVALALGALPAEETSALVAHVAACDACAKELNTAKRLFGAARAAPTPALSADGESRLLAAFRAERDAADVHDATHVPPPAAPKPRASRVLSMFAPLAAAAAVFFAMVAASRTYRVELLDGEGEHLPSGEVAAAPVRATTGLDRPGKPTFQFGAGDEVMSGAGELAIRLALRARDAKATETSPAPGVLEMRLLPGARVRRVGVEEVELVAGAVEVAAGPLGDPFTIRGGRGAGHAVVKGTRFVATTADERMVVVVREGAVELGRAGGKSETLVAGEQGLVDRERLLRRPADARADGDAFLAPRVSLAAGAAPLTFDASLAAGEGGPVSIVAFDDAYPNFVVRISAEGAPDREIKLQRSMLVGQAPAPGSNGAWRLAPDAPYGLSFSLAGIGLAPGRYAASVRYMSYRRHGDGAEWLGVAESARMEFEVPR